MRFVFLNPIGRIGGAEQVLLMMIRASVAAGHSVSLIALEGGALQSEAEALGATVDIIDLPKSLSQIGDTQFRVKSGVRPRLQSILHTVLQFPALFSTVIRLWRTLKKHQPDIIYSNGLKTHLLLWCVECLPFSRMRQIKRFWHIHDYYSQRPAVAKILRFAISKQTMAIAISRSVAEDLQTIAPKLTVSIVLNGVDTESYSPEIEATLSGDQLVDLDRLAGIEGRINSIRVGLVATYSNWKGHSLFLRAFERAYQVEPRLRGYIIGGPIYSTLGSQVTRDQLEQEAIALGIREEIGFIPFQKETRSIYLALDIVVHASIRPEPFGLTIVEAMACGRSVVVSAHGGATELFEHDVHALGFEPGNETSLSNEVLRLAKEPDLRTRLGSAARKHVIKMFDEIVFRDRWLNEVVPSFSECRGELSNTGQTGQRS